MQNKKKSIMTLVILFLFLICSCAEGGCDVKIEISPTDKTVIDLAHHTYYESTLSEIAKFNGVIDDLNKQYPIECIRKKDNIYRVSYLGNEVIAVLMFDKSGNCFWGQTYKMHAIKSDFDRLVKGQMIDEVRSIDPDGDYLFLYTGRNDMPKQSSHYTKDGYLISIEYGNSNEIIQIEVELI